MSRSVVAVSLVAASCFAADFTVKTAEKPAPKEIGESIRAVLQPKALQLLEGDKLVFEIWSRPEIPLKSKPASPGAALDAIAEATLVGAVSIAASGLRDYRDNEISKGLYTARYVLQPQDGDHLGTAEFNYFVALIAADADKELDGIRQYRPLVKTSGKLTSSGHPQIISLRPASDDAAVGSITEPAAEHKAIRVKLSGKPESGEKTDFTVDLIFHGHGHIQ